MLTSCEFFCPKNTAEIVRVKQGELSGMIKGSSFGSVYRAYLGIPYAAPPIGELRFKDPEPPACWKGVRYAKNMSRNMSVQLERFSETKVIGSEDCLYLNVYVPCSLHKGSAQKPVMVWIHGGAFLRGNGNIDETRPDYFMNKDVILVSINYRLGVLGFLNLEHEEANGNQGLKDQVAALKWIKENIASFDGDPNNITVFGCGAGAISTHLLMLSPLSKGLFHKAILQSGVALCSWAVRKQQPEAFKLALLLGCDSKNPKEIVEFLRKCSYERLVQMESNVVTKDAINVANDKVRKSGLQERRIRKVTFGPMIDEESRNSFLPGHPKDLIDEDNDIPILLGNTANEYLGHLADLSKESLNKIQTDLPLYMENLTGPITEHLRSHMSILEFYMGNMQFNKHTFARIVLYMSEIHYNIPIRTVAFMRSARSNVKTYFYLFSYRGEEAKLIARPNQHLEGISHADELIYLFYMPRYKTYNMAPPAPYSQDYNMSHIITTMWSNFAKSGDPNYRCKDLYTQWQPLEENTIKYFDLTSYHNMLISLEKWDKTRSCSRCVLKSSSCLATHQ